MGVEAIPFEITDRLHEQGLIDEPRSNRKSVCLTDEGIACAKAAFEALCSGLDVDAGNRTSRG
jgi:hypothetical protein